MRHSRIAISIAFDLHGQNFMQKETALTYRPTQHKPKQPDPVNVGILGFKIWLSHLGYTRKDLQDGGCTFKHRKLDPPYVVIGNANTMNKGGTVLYKEYCEHLAAED